MGLSLTILLLFALVCCGISTVNAGVFIDPLVLCTPLDSTLCAWRETSTPSPVYDAATQTTNYVGDYQMNFYMVDGIANETSLTDYPESAETYETGEFVQVVYDQNDMCKQVITDAGICLSCTTCSAVPTTTDSSWTGGTFSADCTNLMGGRLVDCEPLLPVFWPFSGDGPVGEPGGGVLRETAEDISAAVSKVMERLT
jgi:hypothetical protein